MDIGHFDESREVFESIGHSVPNPQVVARASVITLQTRRELPLPDGEGDFLLHGVMVHGYARDGLINIQPTPEEYRLMQEVRQPRQRRHKPR